MKFAPHVILLCIGCAIGDAAAAQATPPPRHATHSTVNYMEAKWKLDPRVILPRGPYGTFDSHVVGDPCIVWDEDVNTWRMFYFARGQVSGIDRTASNTAMALSRSAEQIGPTDWQKIGPVFVANPQDIRFIVSWHKWFVIMDARRNNHAARIDGKYWSMFVSYVNNRKVIQVASSAKLAGPWEVRRDPILTNDPKGLDGRSCDTATGFWLEDERRVAIFYKAYPSVPRPEQPGSPFGSSTVLAYWHPEDAVAQKRAPLLQPGREQNWAHGWIGGVQLLYHAPQDRWYGLMNGSPTPPEDKSNREPAPCMGGWITCDSQDLSKGWKVDTKHSPLLHPDRLTEAELAGGAGVNLWRHHLLSTPGGQARIFTNSGAYGTEQMYSYVMVK